MIDSVLHSANCQQPIPTNIRYQSSDKHLGAIGISLKTPSSLHGKHCNPRSRNSEQSGNGLG